MSLTGGGVWKAGVWAPPVWARGVWFEFAVRKGILIREESNTVMLRSRTERVMLRSSSV
jgi:hypothetical protein